MEWKLIVLLISLLPWVGYGETSVSEVRLVCEGQQLDNTMNSIMKLSDEMGDMRNTIKSLDLALKDVASLKVQNTALEASKSVLQKGNEALSARVESLEKGMSSVETNLRSLQQDSTRTKQQNRILTINLSRLQEQGNKVEKATEQLAEMDLALNTSKEELREALNNSIQELKSKGDKDSSNVGMSITDIRADVENLKRSATEGKQYSDQLLDITRELSSNNSISVSNHNRLVSQHATTRADTDALQDGLSELQRESNIILNDHINLKSTDEDIKGNVLSLQNNHNSMNLSLSKLSQNTNDQFIMAEGKVNGSFTEVQTNVDAVVKLILNQSESYMNVLQMMFQSARVEREGIWQAHNGAYGSVNASIIALMNTNRLVSDSLTNLSTDQVQIQQRLETFQLEQLAQNGRIANVWETSAGNLTSLVYGLQSETNDIRTNLSKTIKETDKFINSMGALLNQSVGSKIQGAVSSIENIFSNIEDLKGETRNLSDKLKAGDNRTEAVSRKLEVSIARIEASEKRTDAVNGNLQASIQRIEANEKAIGTSQDDIKMGKNESDNRYLQTQTSISQLQNQTSTAQKESTTNVLTTIRDLKANYSGLQNEVTALKADKSSLFGVVNMLQTQNGATSQSITEMKKDTSLLQEKASTLDQTIKGVQTEQTAIKSDIQKVFQQDKDLVQNNQQQDTRLDGLEQSLQQEVKNRDTGDKDLKAQEDSTARQVQALQTSSSTEISKLQNDYNSLRSQGSQLQRDINTLQDTTTQLATKSSSIKQIAFTGYRKTPMVKRSGQEYSEWTFEESLTNLGNAFNADTGIFKVPVSGTYYISAFGKDYGGTSMPRFGIFKNDNMIVSTFDASQGSGQLGSLCLDAVVTLNANEELQVKSISPSFTIYLDEAMSFSGYLLYESET